MLLKDKNILISGASSGIGKQCAIDASLQGARVFASGRNMEKLEELKKELKGDFHIISADLNSEKGIEFLCDSIPKIQGLVYSAGITSHIPVQFIRSKEYEEVMGINFKSVLLLIALLLKQKKIEKEASLVFLSSAATRHMYFGGALYSASKAALEAYSKTLALELSRFKIRSNCISPTFVNTEMVEKSGETISKEVLLEYEKKHPLGFGDVRDVSEMILFLLSHKSKWITGANIPMGGI
jgi:NAD(P)-dependent dehydrogenase (short-subunit alcohol dehydrogenase family)